MLFKRRVLLEAENKNNVDEPTDYTEDEMDTEESGGEENTDNVEEPTDYTEEETEESVKEDDAGEEGGEDDPNLDSEDYTNSETDTADNESPESMESGEETANKDENKDDKNKNKALLKDMINLYRSIKSTQNKLANISKSDLIINKIVNQVNLNLNRLLEYLFDYIVFKFKENTYAVNLYKYNFFIEAYKINITLLKKINVFRSN